MSDSEDSNGPTATVKGRRKRARAARACDQCFKRKVKCDCDEMPNNICSVCLNLGIDCTHLVERKKRGPKAKVQPRTSSDAKSLITTILSARKSLTIPKEEYVLREMLVNLASYARDLEVQLEQALNQSMQHSLASPQPASRSSPLSQLSDTQEEVEDHDLLILQIESLTLENRVYNKHVGKSSHFMLLQTALNIRDQGGAGNQGTISLKRPELWMRAPWHQFPPEAEDPPYEFPEPDLFRTLLNLYFDKHHSIYPLLHRPSFERQVYVDNLHLTDRRFGAVVLAVCALASRLVDDPRTLYEGSQDNRSAGWKYFKQIRLVRASCVDPLCLYDVQLYALAVIFVFPTPTSSVAWFVLTLGLRSAQEVGAYRKASFKKPMRSRLEEQLWRRAFWSLVSTDLYMSISTGRPRSTREDDFDLELPPECDDEYWEIPSNPQLEFVQPVGKPSHMSHWHHLMKLLHIAGLVKDHLYTTRKAAPWLDSLPDNIDKIVMELDSALNSWMDELPDHLKWDPYRQDDVLFSQTVNLHSNYYWVQIQLHKMFVRPGPLNTGNFPSLAICTNAARSYAHIMQAFRARPGTPMVPNFIAPTFVAAVMLLINLWISLRNKTSYDPRRDMADVYTCLDHLRAYEKRYEHAGLLHDVLEGVISASQMPPPPQKESLKRPRHSHPNQSVNMPDDSIRQFAGTRRASNALNSPLMSMSQGNAAPGVYIGGVGSFQQPSVVPSSVDNPSSIFDPSFGINIAPSDQQALGFDGQEQNFFGAYSSPSFTFDPSASNDAPSLNTGLEDSDFAASFASAWDNSSQEDWSSLMSKVDELLHVVNSDV
ncbi:fungal-specific transcription factor domain-containing protein [Lentinula guzmanii]|uniref:Fungal-specific transcription factor domain-containing protein n=1 Tax=Lentinula guzmanii TaxID=2804957 RepID=A0AA38JGQ2_9AGAR|nr:fungal-specific transcription factor domain-containing protein [Lentinula guzmanii]